MDQFIVCAVTWTLAGQKEKKMPMMVKIKASTVIGTPARPSRKGPQINFDAGVVTRLYSITVAAMAKEL